ncbi:MAG: hypothetical protein GWN79_01795, partial [Actinobacteria bacterium]|nr:hypothetical protein [Actinomycetota bacterium]NIT94291.1 hypothetical protein [Actinomycetota bacterium]NIU17897.1 hypothetical protein [Actinomycetota bacterium]NIX49276.1 hypothetical protein [Actinomycetota bacterium]
EVLHEPFLQLRNQGQVLGAERIGDHVAATGEWKDGVLIASSVVAAPGAGGDVAGELWARTERALQVKTEDDLVLVEVAP